MDTSSTPGRIVGSVLAGAAGFLVGFYASFFLVLSIWSLAAAGVVLVIFTGGLGSIVAGAAIAWTVADGRKWSALLTTVGLVSCPVGPLAISASDFDSWQGHRTKSHLTVRRGRGRSQG